MMDISRDSTDGSELGSRPVARVLLVLENNSAASTLDQTLLPGAAEDVTDASAKNLPASPDVSASSDAAQNGGENKNGSYGNGSYSSYSNGTYTNGLPPSADYGAVADISLEANTRDVAPATDDLNSTPAHPLIKLLTAAGHVVAWTTREDWALDTHGALEHNRPHVVIIEGQAPRDLLVTLCGDLRASEMGRDAGLLTILPPTRRNDRARGPLLEALGGAGVDSFLSANAADPDVLAQVRLMANLARIRNELETAREQLRTQLQTDDQTRLLNRRFFFQAAHRECSRARRYNSELSCLMIEVDHFKRLTAITGFECGEAMLRSVALVLRELTRDSDIVARFDEDKFAVLLPETTIEGATRLREKIQIAVSALDFSWHSTPVPLSVSGGEANRNREIRAAEEAASRLDLDEEEPEDHIDGEPLSAREELAELLAAADAALFVARRGVRFPTLVGEYAQEKPTRALDDDSEQLPSFS